MNRVYAAALLAAGALHLVAAMGPEIARAPGLVVGQLVMLVAIWGLAFIAIPHGPRVGWLMTMASLATSVLLILAYFLSRPDLAGAAAQNVAATIGDAATVTAVLFLGSAGWSLLRAPGPWRVGGLLFVLATGAIPFTWIAFLIFRDSLQGAFLALRGGVTLLLVAFAAGLVWSGALLWRAGG